MIVTDDSWYVVRNTPGVTGFVGSGVKPIPLEDDEVFKILQNMGVEYAHSKFDFEVGETVNVMSGPFENFSGKIVEINKEKGKVRLSISMFGRETPVELDFHQIAKV